MGTNYVYHQYLDLCYIYRKNSMKNIYFLILKKRWFLFTILFLLVFLTNSVLWNESTQLIRRYPAIERLKIEADKGSYESLYIPEADETGALISISMEERNELYHTLLTALRDGRAIYRNKIAYIEKGEKLQLLTAIKLKDIFSKEELSEHFLNDILFKKSRDNKELFKKIIILPVLYSRFFSKEEAILRAKSFAVKFYLEKELDKKVRFISGGQKQRVAIIRSLILNPEIILADEPTTNLDKNNFRLVLEMFQELKKQEKIIIIATHDDRIKKIADRTYKIVNQEIIESP